MTQTPFAPKSIDWGVLKGGTEEAAWVADRNRKVATISNFSDQIIETYEALLARGELFTATPDSLKTIPFAAWWYVSLAGFAQKTLSNIKLRPQSRGMTVSPKTLAENLSDFSKRERFLEKLKLIPNGKDAQNVLHFAEWLNFELDEIFPTEESRTPQAALTHVSMILGGRVIGQGQNTGGNDAVLLVKEQLVVGLRDQVTIETQTPRSILWRRYERPFELILALKIRIGGVIVVEFLGGGTNPDIAVRSYETGEFIVVGEIKGRKDLSNVWESWMPQVSAHMHTWTQEFPNAHRIFIGTLINEEMITGLSKRGTPRNGLRSLYEEGTIATAFNITKIVESDPDSINHFNEFLDFLCELVKSFTSIGPVPEGLNIPSSLRTELPPHSQPA